MAYPPPVPPATRTDATVMATNHPTDHNLISAALSEILNKIASVEAGLYPIGIITPWPGDLPPGNHLLCRGDPVSRAAYPEVFAIIGTKFGAGDGSTTFNMPDLRGRYPIGYNAGGANGAYFTAGVGEKFGSPDAQLPFHNHFTGDHAHGISFLSGATATNHVHGIAATGASGFLSDGTSGTSAAASGGAGYVLNPFTTTPTGAGDSHQHAINGATQNAGAATGTSSQGVTPTNLNLPPSVSFNFVMRMH